jgi:hypothetical protein
MSTPPTPFKRATDQRKSVISEKAGAKLDGGRRVTGSGNKREKGDFRNDVWRIEDKFTDKKSFSLTVADLDKICREALMTPPGLLPQMRISLPGHTVRVIREQDYLWLVAEAAAKIGHESRLPGETF